MSKKSLSSDIETAHRLFTEMLSTHQVEGEKRGVIDFYYAEFGALSNGVFTAASKISALRHYLESQNLIVKIIAGVAGRPSRWDVSAFVDSEIVTTPTSLIIKKTVLRPPVDIEASVDSSDSVDTNEVSRTIKEMMTFLTSTHRDMISHLGGMVSKLATENPEHVKALQEELDRTVTERDTLEEQLRTKTSADGLDKHKIYRLRNQVLDEVERFLITPGWQQPNKTTHFRKTVTTHMNNIMESIGVGEGSELVQ